MRRISLLICTVFTAVSAFGEPSVVELRDSVYVKGPTVTLGDIATVNGDDAEFLGSIELTSAATPGATRRLNAAIIHSRLEQAGVLPEDVEVRGPSSVNATTLYLDLTPDMIVGDLRAYIESEMPWEAGASSVDVLPVAQGLVVSDGHVEFRWRANPGYEYLGTGTFRGEVLVDGRLEQSFYAKAAIETYADVVVAARDVSRGERFTVANLKLEQRALSGIAGGAYFDPADLDGFVAKSSIFKGQPVTEQKIESPILVRRNQLVVVATTIGGLTIQAQAKVMNAAAAGEVVVLESLSSEQEMRGIVEPDGSVTVD